MAEKIKFTAKELKKPDIYRQFFSDLFDKASDNFNIILYSFAGLIIALIILFIFSTHSDKKAAAASKIFDGAVEKLNLGNIEDAQRDFDSLIKDYPSNKSAKLAQYYSGLINYDVGEYEKTIDSLTGFLSTNPEEQLLKQSAQLTIGLSNFNLNNWSEAVNYLSKISDTESPYFRQANVHLGLSYEKLGQHDKAQKIYEDFIATQTSNDPRNMVRSLPPDVGIK